jgi:hypothetical protein
MAANAQAGATASRRSVGAQRQRPKRAVAAAPPPLCRLPVLGDTTTEDAVFYGAVGTLFVAGWLELPAAGLFAAGHALHQRVRNVTRTGEVGELREGAVEVVDDVL